MKTINQITSKMDCNGYAYFDNEAFLNKSNEICYIPENAENISDCYTYNDLLNICEKHIKNNNLKLKAKDLVNVMYDSLEWEFPETWIDWVN